MRSQPFPEVPTKKGSWNLYRVVGWGLVGLLCLAALVALSWFIPGFPVRNAIGRMMTSEEQTVAGLLIAFVAFIASQIWSILSQLAHGEVIRAHGEVLRHNAEVLRHNALQIRLQNRIEYQKLLFEPDKMLMQAPFLRAMLDGNERLLDRDDRVREGQMIQVEAYASYHINLFEIVYVFFHNNKEILTTEEDAVYVAWMKWLDVILRTSAVFCRVLEQGIKEESYNQWFVDYVSERKEYKDYLAKEEAKKKAREATVAGAAPPA